MVIEVDAADARALVVAAGRIRRRLGVAIGVDDQDIDPRRTQHVEQRPTVARPHRPARPRGPGLGHQRVQVAHELVEAGIDRPPERIGARPGDAGELGPEQVRRVGAPRQPGQLADGEVVLHRERIAGAGGPQRGDQVRLVLGQDLRQAGIVILVGRRDVRRRGHLVAPAPRLGDTADRHQVLQPVVTGGDIDLRILERKGAQMGNGGIEPGRIGR